MPTPGSRSRLPLWVGALLLVGLAGPASGVCPEPPESTDGARKGLARRDFEKALRHEIGVLGGLFMSELMGAAPLAGLSYTFHATEDFGVEVAFAYTYLSSKLAAQVEGFTGYELLEDEHAFMYQFGLVWHPIHGKFMLLNAAIPHFDFYLSAGLGLTDSHTNEGLTYHVGLGVKIFGTDWLSVRLDVRDHIQVQNMLGSQRVTNSLSLALGVGFWLP
jgi:outer membrane beta-barrel protein